MKYCFVYRSGEIRFHRAKITGYDNGAMFLCDVPNRAARLRIEVRARLAYDNKTLLCPGIPEAENELEAYEAFSRFKEFVSVKEKASA